MDGAFLLEGGASVDKVKMLTIIYEDHLSHFFRHFSRLAFFCTSFDSSASALPPAHEQTRACVHSLDEMHSSRGERARFQHNAPSGVGGMIQLECNWRNYSLLTAVDSSGWHYYCCASKSGYDRLYPTLC